MRILLVLLAAAFALFSGPSVAQVSILDPTVTQITTGDAHSCALTARGGVMCWGSNGAGQLGDNSTSQRLAPTDVSTLATGVAQIAAGAAHTCALTDAGGVQCWGSNTNGQLGDNSSTTRLAPVDVSGLTSGVAAIAAGFAHTCALTAAGGVKCWGRNDLGQLGDATNTQRLVPVNVSGLTSGVVAIAAGGLHTCAITTAGGLKCWGNNASGQLGDNTTTTRSTPFNVFGLTSGVTNLAAGNTHTCAIVTGAAKCWGDNGFGQLGDNSTTQRLIAVNVVGMTSGVTSISADNGYTCAVVSGAAKCWGLNSNSQLGDNSTTQRLTPSDVVGMSTGTASISAGPAHACATTTQGALKCWGNNTNGRIGDNSTTSRPAPVNVAGLGRGVGNNLAAGRSHSCALSSGGGVTCWGTNIGGQLGDGTTTNRLAPVAVKGLASGVVALAARAGHTCALTLGGGVKCWGNNFDGELGDGTTTDRLVPNLVRVR